MMRHLLPRRASNYVTFVALGLTLLYFTFCRFTMGIGNPDDLWYMGDAVAFQWRYLARDHYWSPLYCAWMHAVAVLVPNGLWEYFVSWAILLLALTFLPALFRLRYSWIYALVLLGGPFFSVTPFIWIFSAMFVTLGTCVVLYKQRTAAEALFAACVTSFFLSFVRSEFDHLVWIAGAASLGALIMEARDAAKDTDANEARTVKAWRPRLMIAGIALLCGCMGYVKRTATGERSGMAFAQHFNIRASERGELKIPPVAAWMSDYAERAFGVDVGHTALTSTATLGDFFRANPRLFLRHVATNLLDWKTLIFMLFVAIVLSLPWLRENGTGPRMASLLVAALTIPTLIEIATIYPRDHYALIVFPALLLLLLQNVPEHKMLDPPLVIVFGAGALLMLAFNVIVPRLMGNLTPQEERMALLQIRCVQLVDMMPASNSTVFESRNINDILLVRQHTLMDRSTLPLWSDFKTWSSTTHPAWITVDASLPATYGVQPAEIDAYLRGPLGYVAHPCSAKAGMTVYSPRIQ